MMMMTMIDCHIHCRSVGVYTVTFLSLLPRSVEVTASPSARLGRAGALRAPDGRGHVLRERRAGRGGRRGRVPVREKQIGSSGGSLEPPRPLLEPPTPLLTHLHTDYTVYYE